MGLVVRTGSHPGAAGRDGVREGATGCEKERRGAESSNSGQILARYPRSKRQILVGFAVRFFDPIRVRLVAAGCEKVREGATGCDGVRNLAITA